MNRKKRKQVIKIILSMIISLLAFLIKFESEKMKNGLLIIAYVIVGGDIVLKALRNIFKGKVLDENFLMTVATLGAFGIGEFPEAVAVMIFYQMGEFFQSYAVDKSRKSISNLMEIRPDYANVYRGEEIVKVDPNDINMDEIIVVKAGEKIPLDGVIIEGESMLDTKALTGESIPRKVTVKDNVLSGCINQTGLLKIKVTKEFEESTVSKILDLVENASNRKAVAENFISKFARIYTPVVVIIALVLAILPPLILKENTFNTWCYRALSFLVVSCPCALVISIPLSFFGGIGAASKIGILIKGSNYLEALAKTEIIACDKTGTLTEGIFKVQKIETFGLNKNEILKMATLAESFSNHPISLSLKEAYGKKINEKLITTTQEISGKGVLATIDGKQVLVGNEKLMKESKIKFTKSKEEGTLVYVAINNELAGIIVISDKIKEDAYEAIKQFKRNHVKKVVMLTGDHEQVSAQVAKSLHLDDYYAELLPQEKCEQVEKLMTEKSKNGKVIFVGDGINDAPVLALTDIGISMGGLGSDAAIEASDVVIMTDEPSKIAHAIQISRKTMRIVRQNIFFAITIKIGVLVLSALGLASMWASVFADVGVSILAILNALRLLKIKKIS